MSTNLTNLTANPTVPEYSDDLEWVTAYLVAHMMSEPSRRYVWILWLCIGSVFLFYTFLNLTGKRLGGHYTALWRRWAIQRRTWRGLIRRSGKKKPPALLPSNGQLITLIVLPIVTLLLAFGGPDYIAPDTFIFNLKSPKIHARGYDTSSYTQFQPQYQINKAWWTAGGRTGLIAFGLFPLVVLFALKAPPFAFFALPFTTQLHFDKLSWLHKWSARLLYLMSLLHVVLWSVQLAKDHRPSTGEPGYTYAWKYEKFFFGWIAFGAMTILVFSSSRPIRRSHYETFYGLHILLVPITIVFSALHHPRVWEWCWVAMLIWVSERCWRGMWWLQMNGFFGKEKSAPVVSYRHQSPNSPITPSTAGSYPPLSPYVDPRFMNMSDGNLLAPATALEYTPPPGFVHAELLSGATVRLTYITPGFLSWAPGQHFLINIPSVSRFLTHPFTTASICDEQAAPSGRAIVFLVRCKNGWTRDLWDHVVQLQKTGHHDPRERLPNGTVMPQRGVLLKMFVDGPFGSSVKAKWGDYSTVVIFAAGSGISFALSILEFVCLCMAGRDGKHLGGHPGSMGSKGYKTRRVRFVWLIREYAHIQWCAGILRRCLSMIPEHALEVEIFVTTARPPSRRTMAAPPREASGTHLAPPNRWSTHSAESEDSVYSDEEEADETPGRHDVSSYYGGRFSKSGGNDPEADFDNWALDLTNWADERDDILAGEARFSMLVRKEGNYLRRMSRMTGFTNRMSMAVPNRMSMANGRMSMANGRMSMANGRMSIANGKMSMANDRMSKGSIATPFQSGGSTAFHLPTHHRPSPLNPTTHKSSPLKQSAELPSEDPPYSADHARAQSNDALLYLGDSPRPRDESAMPGAESDLGSRPDSFYDVSSPVPRPIDSQSPPTSPMGQSFIIRPVSTTSSWCPPSPLQPHTPTQPSSLQIVTSPEDWPQQPNDEYDSEKQLETAVSIHHEDFPTEGYTAPVDSSTLPKLHIDSQEMRDVSFVSMNARPGRPSLEQILRDEVEHAQGSLIVACCGPASFNAIVRKAVANEIDPEKVRRGDARGYIDLVSEEFEF